MQISDKLGQFLEQIGSKETRINERGSAVHHYWASLDRYLFDFKLCTPEAGWQQYDTSQDAWYFGVWVNVAQRLIFTYCEGDMYLVNCPDVARLKAELEDMARFYGDPPPAAIAIDEDGITEYYDKRPSA